MADGGIPRGSNTHPSPAAIAREPTLAGITPANALEFHLDKYKPDSPTYNKVLRLKELVAARAAVFPAPSPKRSASRGGRK